MQPSAFIGGQILIVRSKFVRQEAVEIYYIPWPTKKLLPKILTKLVCQKQPKAVQPAQPTSQSCQKKQTSKKHTQNGVKGQIMCINLIFYFDVTNSGKRQNHKIMHRISKYQLWTLVLSKTE